jgi:hypothetical protein
MVQAAWPNKIQPGQHHVQNQQPTPLEQQPVPTAMLSDSLPGLLIYLFIIPIRVGCLNQLGPPVVFPYKDGGDAHNQGVLIDVEVA